MEVVRETAVESGVIGGLVLRNQTKIVLFVIDGLGGLPREMGGKTELETAETPHLDALAREGICGLHEPVRPGITPGSGPAHLALFGYDPIACQVGRGVLSALGIDFELQPEDVAARGNFCTLDESGRVADRRAGRISTEKNRELCEILGQIELPGAQVLVRTVKEHRFLLVLRGQELYGDVSDTDPQKTGVAPLPPKPLVPDAEGAAQLVETFVQEARHRLADHHPANGVLLRGFSKEPDWPSVHQRFGLRAAAIAMYPMYRGVAKLVGMEALAMVKSLEEGIELARSRWDDFDFIYLHYKDADEAGEDGDFARKVATIEEVDSYVPRIQALGPDVLVVTGDHSTPSILKAHSWHPVPIVLWSRYCRSDTVSTFGERACLAGGLGPHFPAVHTMPIMLANALRLEKFGA